MEPGTIALFIIVLAVVGGLLAFRWLNAANGPFMTVFEWEHGVAYRNGRFEALLPPGRYFTWPRWQRSIFKLRRGEQVLTMGPFDVTSSDKLVYRMSATFIYRFADPRQALENSYVERINVAVATALVRLASERTLEALMTDRAALDSELRDLIGSPIAGCELVSATIGGVVLPPEVRRLFSEVERARLEGAAALERARGEQASLRSLANTARMLKGNPELMNLRVLQALSSRGAGTLVLGSNAILPVGEGGSETS